MSYRTFINRHGMLSTYVPNCCCGDPLQKTVEQIEQNRPKEPCPVLSPVGYEAEQVRHEVLRKSAKFPTTPRPDYIFYLHTLDY